ncbi:MAG: isopenicillin N synthase family oxygenase [Actinomycetota bacterium]|nr:isopenicillin N synthase family oxygenase [Actinomycetota bacterium]
MTELPVVDITALREGGDVKAVAGAIDRACREVGFFYVVGHGVDERLPASLEQEARAFFALDDGEKAALAMARGGRAWRGWFPLGAELTSGEADGKEGLYFGTELGDDHARVQEGVPLHGRNLFPAQPDGLRGAVLAYLDAMTALGHTLARGVALALGLDGDWIRHHLTREPTVLFRIFRYPPAQPGWGVGEHSDYGLLTLLRQDDHGGLEVRTRRGWIDAPPLAGSFVCNLGDMLDRMTGGRYRSTPHRVRNTGDGDRLSFAFFFDPSWDAEVRPLPLEDEPPEDDAGERWDGTSLQDLSGTYGEYLLTKVSKVFPHLRAEVLEP